MPHSILAGSKSTSTLPHAPTSRNCGDREEASPARPFSKPIPSSSSRIVTPSMGRRPVSSLRPMSPNQTARASSVKTVCTANPGLAFGFRPFSSSALDTRACAGRPNTAQRHRTSVLAPTRRFSTSMTPSRIEIAGGSNGTFKRAAPVFKHKPSVSVRQDRPPPAAALRNDGTLSETSRVATSGGLAMTPCPRKAVTNRRSVALVPSVGAKGAIMIGAIASSIHGPSAVRSTAAPRRVARSEKLEQLDKPEKHVSPTGRSREKAGASSSKPSAPRKDHLSNPFRRSLRQQAPASTVDLFPNDSASPSQSKPYGRRASHNIEMGTPVRQSKIPQAATSTSVLSPALEIHPTTVSMAKDECPITSTLAARISGTIQPATPQSQTSDDRRLGFDAVGDG